MAERPDERVVSDPGRWGCWTALAIVLAAMVAWEALARADVLSVLFFPGPSRILASLGRLAARGTLAADAGCTLARLLVSFAIGAVPAALLGLAMGWSRSLRSVADPLVAAFHPVPKTALLPLFMIILGIGESPKVAVAALAAFFPVLISAMAGVRQISPIHFEVAQNYHASRARVFWRVVVPGSLPLLLAGIRLGLNGTLVVIIAVEMLFARQGLGALLWTAWETMRTEELYAVLAVTCAVGVSANLALRALTQRLVPWQVEAKV